MAGGLYIIIAISVCALLIAANCVRRNRSSSENWNDQFSDADQRLLDVLNNHDRPYADWSQRNHG